MICIKETGQDIMGRVYMMVHMFEQLNVCVSDGGGVEVSAASSDGLLLHFCIH